MQQEWSGCSRCRLCDGLFPHAGGIGHHEEGDAGDGEIQGEIQKPEYQGGEIEGNDEGERCGMLLHDAHGFPDQGDKVAGYEGRSDQSVGGQGFQEQVVCMRRLVKSHGSVHESIGHRAHAEERMHLDEDHGSVPDLDAGKQRGEVGSPGDDFRKGQHQDQGEDLHADGKGEEFLLAGETAER